MEAYGGDVSVDRVRWRVLACGENRRSVKRAEENRQRIFDGEQVVARYPL